MIFISTKKVRGLITKTNKFITKTNKFITKLKNLSN